MHHSYNTLFKLFLFYPKQSFHQSRQIDEFDIWTQNISVDATFQCECPAYTYKLYFKPCNDLFDTCPMHFHRIYWMFGYHRIAFADFRIKSDATTIDYVNGMSFIS